MNPKTKVLILVAGVGVVVGYIVFSTDWIKKNHKASAKAGGAAVKEADSFVGGTFEASGIARVAGTDAFLFVDDGRSDEVLWIELDKSGKQAGSIIPVKLGVAVEDPEGITTDGSYFYVVGSQSRSKHADRAGLVRFRFNKETKTAEDVQALSQVRQFLVENVAELRGSASEKAKSVDGIDIEGLAWDPTRNVLLIGLRSPVIDGKALLVPLKMRDSRGAFTADNIEAGNIDAIRLPLGGMGIRSIEYDESRSLFQIIAGATDSQDKTDFKLWEWSGQTDGSGLREITSFDRKLQPEGVASGTVEGKSFTVVVFDTSRYLTLR